MLLRFTTKNIIQRDSLKYQFWRLLQTGDKKGWYPKDTNLFIYPRTIIYVCIFTIIIVPNQQEWQVLLQQVHLFAEQLYQEAYCMD